MSLRYVKLEKTVKNYRYKLFIPQEGRDNVILLKQGDIYHTQEVWPIFKHVQELGESCGG